MQWEIGTLNVQPNGRLCIYDIESTVYEGGLKVEAVKIDLVLRKLLERKIRLKELEIVRPSVELTEKDLAAMLYVQASKKPDEPIELAMHTSEDAEGTEAGTVVEGEEAETLVRREVEEMVRETKRKIEVQPSGKVEERSPLEREDEYEAWVRVVDGSLRVTRGEQTWLSLENLEAEVPVGGVQHSGGVRWGEIVVAGRQIVDEGEITVEKEHRVISVQQTEVNFFGLDVKPNIWLVRGGHSGLLFQVDVEVPEQSARELMTHLDLTVGMAVESVFGEMRLVGDLMHPFTWRALANVQAKNIEVAEGHRGSYSQFDHFQFQSVLQRGVLQVPRWELIGEDVSVLSNGVLTMRGYGFGVCRLVASEQKKQWVEKLQGGSQVIQGARRKLMQPLESNDVYYMDVEVDGSVLDPMVRVANASDWQHLWDVLERLRSFVVHEREEARREITTGQQ